MPRKTPILLAVCLSAGTLLAGCGNNAIQNNGPQTTNDSAESNTTSENTPEEGSTNSSSSENTGDENGNINLEVGIDTALTDLDALKSTVENSSDDVAKLNEQGKTLESHWDLIEPKMEEDYPDEYKEIEKTLYPLIDEAKKDDPDTAKMSEWIDQTIMTMTEFKENLKPS
ncbi:hypothetical protein ABFG93_06080 [Pseudalkalibacillus hwajinpoensis]|uniref:hypothetical protein n=1 Tax=Guptibacillus hwajinpoensis TaxID=208199 RepID=UPI00325BECA2